MDCETMAKYQKLDVTVVSGKGQVVIPQPIRQKLGIKPKTRLLVYGYQNAVIMKKMEIPDVVEDLKALYKRIEPRIAKYGELSEEEIEEIIQTYRKEKSGR
jgi:AbrB family looped-hinge helix DNA binding protein